MTNLVLDADSHNFGKKVQLVNCGSDFCFVKPRTVFWEWLFFSQTSPLRDLLLNSEDQALRDFAQLNFGLSVDIGSTWCGKSKSIGQQDVSDVNQACLFSARLLAYCYVFGINDLHRGNLVMQSTSFQVVDCEIVLVKSLLPHESVLLPIHETAPDKCGLWFALSFLDGDPDRKNLFIQSFIEMLVSLAAVRASVMKLLSDLDCSGVPVRVILRNTLKYKTYIGLAESDIRDAAPDLIPAEVEQLSRGDIPYFFKFLENQDMYSFTGVDSYSKVITNDERVRRSLVKFNVTRTELFTQGRFFDELLPFGGLYIIKKLYNFFPMEFDGQGFSFVSSRAGITLKCGSREWTTLN